MAMILVVDDEPNILAVLEQFLIGAGHSVFTAGDARQAISLIHKNKFDVVISDIIMPKISGADLVSALKDAAIGAIFILITGHPETDTAKKAKEIGAFRYLLKPISKQQFLDTVEEAIKAKNALLVE